MTKAQETLTLRPRLDVSVPKAAMVLSAGLGRRMRPLTATRPKPLIQVRGRPLVDYALQNLERAGVTRAVINVHYLADQVEAHVGRLQTALDIRLSDERAELLETGGGTKKALDLIDADPFLVTNSDNILIDGPVDAIELLAQRWDPERMDALLLLVPLMKAHGYAGRGDFRMERDGSISRRTGHRIAPFVYSGTQIVKRSLFADAPEGKFSFNVIFDRLLAKGRLFGVSHVGEWYHVGTPDAVKATERLLSGE